MKLSTVMLSHAAFDQWIGPPTAPRFWFQAKPTLAALDSSAACRCARPSFAGVRVAVTM